MNTVFSLKLMCVTLMMVPFFAVGQWSTSGANIYSPAAGNVGIGTATPLGKLDVNGSILLPGSSVNTMPRPVVGSVRIAGEISGYSRTALGADDGFLRLSAGAGTNWPTKSFIDLSGYSLVPDLDRNIIFGTGGAERIRIISNGNVGIGTSNPSYALDVVKNIRVGAQGGSDYTLISGGAGVGSKIQMFYGDGSENNCLTGNNDNWLAASIGNVGIGTRSPTEKLSVNGKIRAREIKVENANWPDFVFAKDYALPTLEETEKHIKEKGHLQGIPSAAEVAKNGIDLGDMNTKLLQKIEELTLYLIEQKKEIQTLNSKVESLQKNQKRY